MMQIWTLDRTKFLALSFFVFENGARDAQDELKRKTNPVLLEKKQRDIAYI